MVGDGKGDWDEGEGGWRGETNYPDFISPESQHRQDIEVHLLVRE